MSALRALPLCGAVAIGALVAAFMLAGGSSAAPLAIYKVQVIHISVQPYRPVFFRIAVHGSVGDEILIGFKIWDRAGHGVYSPPPSEITSYTQPYQATALSLSWSKRGYDGNLVPRGVYEVSANATDITSHGKGVWSPPVSFRLGS